MYYLRKEQYETVIPEIKKTDGVVIPERKAIVEDRTVYKDRKISRFYIGPFCGLSVKYQGMKVYTCKTIKRIVSLRKELYEYCNEWFNIYEESGKVDLDFSKYEED